jgi:hypothetical protein
MSVMSELDLIKRDLIESTQNIITFFVLPGERILLGQMNKQFKNEEGKVLFRVREFILLVKREGHYLCWSNNYLRPTKVENKSFINLLETLEK